MSKERKSVQDRVAERMKSPTVKSLEKATIGNATVHQVGIVIGETDQEFSDLTFVAIDEIHARMTRPGTTAAMTEKLEALALRRISIAEKIAEMTDLAIDVNKNIARKMEKVVR